MSHCLDTKRNSERSSEIERIEKVICINNSGEEVFYNLLCPQCRCDKIFVHFPYLFCKECGKHCGIIK